MSRQVHRGSRKPFGFWRTPDVIRILGEVAAGRMAREEAYRRLEITHYGEAKAAETLDWYVHKLRRTQRGRYPVYGGPGTWESHVASVERVTLGRGGRLVIPATFRHALALSEGDELLLRLEDGSVRILTPGQALKQAQALVRERARGRGSLAAELLEERKQEGSRE